MFHRECKSATASAPRTGSYPHRPHGSNSPRFQHRFRDCDVRTRLAVLLAGGLTVNFTLEIAGPSSPDAPARFGVPCMLVDPSLSAARTLGRTPFYSTLSPRFTCIHSHVEIMIHGPARFGVPCMLHGWIQAFRPVHACWGVRSVLPKLETGTPDGSCRSTRSVAPSSPARPAARGPRPPQA
jgi:hypothetical protein